MLRGARLRHVGAVALFVLLALLAAWKWRPNSRSPVVVARVEHPSAPVLPDTTLAQPPRTFATPYRNVGPGVSYVGDAACSACHPRQSTTYQRHPMGRSLSPVATASALERYDAAAHLPFATARFRYAVERRHGQQFHKETAIDSSGTTLWEMEAEVHFAIGSGERGRSYLLHRDGYLFASPLSWYSQKGIWDLSPGYASNPDCAPRS